MFPSERSTEPASTLSMPDQTKLRVFCALCPTQGCANARKYHQTHISSKANVLGFERFVRDHPEFNLAKITDFMINSHGRQRAACLEEWNCRVDAWYQSIAARGSQENTQNEAPEPSLHPSDALDDMDVDSTAEYMTSGSKVPLSHPTVYGASSITGSEGHQNEEEDCSDLLLLERFFKACWGQQSQC